MMKRIVTLGVLLFLVLGSSGLAQQPTFETTDCWFEVPEGIPPIDCGYLVVPEDRSDPESPEIRLAVAILRHPGGNPESDPVIHIAGGPGERPLKFLTESYQGFASFFDIDREVIILEMRGVGFSEPALDCDAYGQAFVEILDFRVIGRTIDARRAGEFIADVTAECIRSLSQKADLAAYNSLQHAGDVNDLRIALGYDQVNLHTASYGTRVGQSVMRHYPEIVRSVILDSAEAIGDGFVGGMAEANDRFEALLADCAASESCSQAFPNLRQTWFAILAKLDDSPVELQPVNALTGEPYKLLLNSETLSFAVFLMQMNSNLVPLVPLVITMANEGQYDLILQIYEFFPIRVSSIAASWGNHFSVNCHEMAPFVTEEAYRATLASLPLGTAYWEIHPQGPMLKRLCDSWPSGTVDPAEGEPFESSIPTLVMGGQYDSAVPFPQGRRIAETLENSHFFVYPGMGHVVSTSHPCPNAMMLAFVADPHSAPDAGCIEAMARDFRILTAFPDEVAEAPSTELDTKEFASVTGLFSVKVPAGWSVEELVPGGAFVMANSEAALDRYHGSSAVEPGDFVLNVGFLPYALLRSNELSSLNFQFEAPPDVFLRSLLPMFHVAADAVLSEPELISLNDERDAGVLTVSAGGREGMILMFAAGDGVIALVSPIAFPGEMDEFQKIAYSVAAEVVFSGAQDALFGALLGG
jgi:pimeloyl-ACP methyl ester carboxylesterase